MLLPIFAKKLRKDRVLNSFYEHVWIAASVSHFDFRVLRNSFDIYTLTLFPNVPLWSLWKHQKTPWTQEVFWTSYVRSIYVLIYRGSKVFWCFQGHLKGTFGRKGKSIEWTYLINWIGKSWTFWFSKSNFIKEDKT